MIDVATGTEWVICPKIVDIKENDTTIVVTLRSINEKWYDIFLNCNDYLCGMYPRLWKRYENTLTYEKRGYDDKLVKQEVKKFIKKARDVYKIHNLIEETNYDDC